MKALISAAVLLAASTSFADLPTPECLALAPNAIYVSGNVVVIEVLGSLGLQLPKERVESFVRISEETARSEKVPFCETINETSAEVVSNYRACYAPRIVELEFLGHGFGVTFCTSDFKAALLSGK